MITIDELKTQLGEYETAVKDLGEALAITASEKRVAELEHKMSQPGFYDDAEASQKVFAEVSDLKGKLERYGKLTRLYDDADTMLLLCEEENDPEMIPEAEESVHKVAEAIDELQMITLLSGEYDKNNAILTFHAGTGGTEAQDWADMLFRMYNRWATAHGFKVSTLDYQDGDEAGMKSGSIMVEGPNAYGLLKSENGVHRLVRISPFDANSRRQTSFASLEVMPELDDSIHVDIRPEDIEMQVYRSSGAGGQHINKTSSAIRVTHIPTNTVVECQDERSQHKNKEKALSVLRSRLYEAEVEKQRAAIAADRKSQVGTGDRSERIRTYNFPENRVSDHRIKLTIYKLDQFLNGDMDEILDALIAADTAEKLRQQSEA